LKVNEFYFPADFVILDTELVTNPNNHSPVILGRLFLTTADVIIRCRNGVMILSFGNMTVELNVFHTNSQLSVMDDYEGVNMIIFRSITPLRSLIMKILWRNAWPFLDKILTLMSL